MMEFHIARAARERYGFAETLFTYTGNVVLGSVALCREFAHRMNLVRDVEKHPDQAVHAGSLYAMGLIDEACHVLIARYREQFDPEVLQSALNWFGGQLGSDNLDALLLAFVEQFPGSTVIRGDETAAEWLAGAAGGLTNREAALEELLMLWMANRNEAFKPFAELFDDSVLSAKTVYKEVTAQLPEYFATRPLIPLAGASPVSLLDLLRSPALRSPGSLAEQLEIIRSLWRPLLGDVLDRMILLAGEVLREESLAIWALFNPPGQRSEAEEARRQREQQHWTSVVATAEVPEFGDPAHEYEKFSDDTAWMPGVVLMAKSTYVWLAQMSRQYGRHIGHLDEIPDQELATLARRGINSLWLIGIWERSRASRTIKQLTGNPDAVASAYSLFDYRIADDLGGEAAYINLRDRAHRYGIRLASDMVPNHMGIDSPWVVEHPEWFLSRQDTPYPAYSFNGPDLSSDNRVEIKIEDHYFEQSDAAVVFRRRDKASGETRYIYHGNDGTSFPWNDTAQLDYMNAAVREHVIQTILHVARLFPVIRFDAAMTLAKRHFHRLWFPGPGSSGAIPSRAEYGLTQPEFDRAMPHEFWREVVDRVAAEVPGTLLLAEAFWLMEGYFVRTLGMHRVYNSAFMVMLRDEDNAKYRSVLKNTLEFDPDIMKRYVNFMSNPDERTAIDQFGKGDKCFGVAVMMSTLPGLPMFGHGQIEGYTEKYGMEYRWPRYQETPDPWLVERHEREIAPLLKRRWLFAESGEFLLYDFFTGSGAVDENVFAYSNRNGDQRALVIFNNRYGSTHGTIDLSAAYADKGSGQLRQRRLRDGLGLSGDPNVVLAFRDSLTGLEYLRRAADVLDRGLTLGLGAYQSHVLLDWRELRPTAAEPWDRLADQLNGRGVPSLHDELLNLELRPVHEALKSVLDPVLVRAFAAFSEHPPTAVHPDEPKTERERNLFFAQVWERAAHLVEVASQAYTVRLSRAGVAAPVSGPLELDSLSASLRTRLRAALRIPALEALFPQPWSAAARRVLPSPSPEVAATAIWGPVLSWSLLGLLADAVDADQPNQTLLDLFDRLRLRQPIAEAMTGLGYEGDENWRVAARIKAGLLVGAGVGREVSPAESADTVPVSLAPEEIAEETQAIAEELPAPAEQPEAAGTVPTEDQPKAIAPALWADPDIRWLAGVHEAGEHSYLVRECYEELLWWLELPALLELAADPASPPDAVAEILGSVEAALAAAESAGYRADLLEAKAPEAVAEASHPEPTEQSIQPDPNSDETPPDEDEG
jgi:glycosidase